MRLPEVERMGWAPNGFSEFGERSLCGVARVLTPQCTYRPNPWLYDLPIESIAHDLGVPAQLLAFFSVSCVLPWPVRRSKELANKTTIVAETIWYSFAERFAGDDSPHG